MGCKGADDGLIVLIVQAPEEKGAVLPKAIGSSENEGAGLHRHLSSRLQVQSP